MQKIASMTLSDGTVIEPLTAAPVPTAPCSGAGELLDGLNSPQREAVLHRGFPLLIVAGAGSGKTSVLTRRIAYLLSVCGVRPHEILAITFTNKAAEEMRERVGKLVGPRAKNMWVKTFHSTCVRILHDHTARLPGMSTNFTIYNADDSRNLLALVSDGMNFDKQRYTPGVLATEISNLKNELIGPEEAAVRAAGPDSSELSQVTAAVYARYQYQLRAANAFDFDDLISETVALLQRNPDVAMRYRKRFRHIMVDEYQDTNHAQYVLVRELVGVGSPDTDAVPMGELCVVGDADQSIYAFRGATIRNIEDFENDFPAARTILLEQNYRSTQTILSAANAVIANNPNRRDKNLWTNAGDGAQLVGYIARDEHDEAVFIAAEIDNLVRQGEITYSDAAVFYRTNNSSRVVEDAFIRAGIPYKMIGGVRFYERREIRDVLAYLRALNNPSDTVSLRRILNTPRRGIGGKTGELLTAHAASTNQTFARALADAEVGTVPGIPARTQKAIGGFLTLLRTLQDQSRDNLGVLVETILDVTGYRRQLESSPNPEDLERLDNINELVSVAYEFTTEKARSGAPEESVDQDLPPDALAEFLDQVALIADADGVPDNASGMVSLMTLHSSKGLEFPAVFAIGWEENMFPHAWSLSDPEQISEERRLAYVGITRARRWLYLTCAEERQFRGRPMSNNPSRFLKEVPDDLITWRHWYSPKSFLR